MAVTRIAAAVSFPTSVVLDDHGSLYVAASGLASGAAEHGGRVWRLRGDGRELVVDGLRPPVTGLAWDAGELLISEGGHPGRICAVTRGGTTRTIVDGLPSPGNYHVNMPAVGPDGRVYFSQGAMTNSGIVGLDGLDLAWLAQLSHQHDVPGRDVTLAGVAVETADPRSTRPATATTGAFAPFGVAPAAGTRLAAAVPATAAVMSCARDGGDLRVEAWGLRNAFGLAFLPDGRLLALDQGPDDRGSRPIGNAPDLLYEVRRGAWYGWPDFVGGIPVTDERFTPTRGPRPRPLLANHDELGPPERPLVAFPPHSAATKLAVAPDTAPWPGHLVVALFGDEPPMTVPPGPRAARGLVRIDPSDWSVHRLAGPPSIRPIDVAFGPDGALYVVDFGHFEMTPHGAEARPATGSVWRVDAGDLARED